MVTSVNSASRFHSLVRLFLLSLGSLVGVSSAVAADDWPQWRGPARDGVTPQSPPLTTEFPRTGPPQLWQSEELPGRSGCGSVVVAGGDAYVYVNWPEDEAIATRRIDGSVLNRVRWFEVEDVPPSLLEKLEAARLSVERPAERRELDNWIDTWLEAHLSGEELRKKWQNRFKRRLRDGEKALSIPTIEALGRARNRTFESAAALEGWLDQARIEGEERERIVEAIPTTRRIANDVIVCVDMKDGATRWKASFEGEPRDADASSTPCITGGKLFFQGTKAVHCVDARTGDVVWSTPAERGTPSSPLVVDDKVVVLNGKLTAYHLGDGSVAWTQETLRGRRSSPVAWENEGTQYIICNDDERGTALVRASDGEMVWEELLPGGGLSTPVVRDDLLVVHSGDKKLGLVAYRLSLQAPEQLWAIPLDGRGASSPCIAGEHVYLMGSNVALCVELASGKVVWKERASAEISSPVIADGKLFAVTSNGRALTALVASPEAHRELVRTRVSAARCPSPALVDGKLVLRLRDGIGCFDLRQRAEP